MLPPLSAAYPVPGLPLELCLSLLHLCTRRSRICTFARYPYLPLSPCPHVPSRPSPRSVKFWLSDLMERQTPRSLRWPWPRLARHDLRADDRRPMTRKRMANEPARIPNQARTMPNFSGFLLISRIARTPNHMANGAGKTKIESSPK